MKSLFELLYSNELCIGDFVSFGHGTIFAWKVEAYDLVEENILIVRCYYELDLAGNWRPYTADCIIPAYRDQLTPILEPAITRF